MIIFFNLIDTDTGKQLFVTVYNKYKNMMYHIAYNILHDPGLSEDAVQEAFIKLARNIDKINDSESAKTRRYLITISKNTAIDIYRKHHKITENELCVDEMEPYAPMAFYAEESEKGIYRTIQNLPPKYRDIIFLKYSSGYSDQEISEIMDIRIENVRQRISRGKKMIQNYLANEGGDVNEGNG